MGRAISLRTEAVRITVQNLLSSESDASSRKAKNDALVEYYSVPDQRLLWVDNNGLNKRAIMVMAEIGKADDYGLRAADYSLPDGGDTASEPKPRDWLADAEVKVSYAVLSYAKDARGGRIEPLRLSKNLVRASRCPILRKCSNQLPFAQTPAHICAASSPTRPNSRRCGKS
jgi:murein L,D-transpeptidase YcbB/YkuD